MKRSKLILTIIFLNTLVFARGLESSKIKPIVRLGALPFDFFIYEEAPNDLGQHRYRRTRYDRKNKIGNTRGILYSCNAGFIDFAHMQEGIDFGAYYVKKVEEAYLSDKLYFEDLTVPEKSIFKIKLEYPTDWNTLSKAQKKSRIKENSIKIGLYIAHVKLTWHEIVTWHGWSSTVFRYLEQTSSFSYEDPVSNILGLYIAKKAIEDDSLSFNDAVTKVINNMFDPLRGELRRLPKEFTSEAQSRVEGNWYVKQSRKEYYKDRKVQGKEKIKLPLIYGIGAYVKRATNVGLEGEIVSPLLIENFDKCENTKPLEIIVPGSVELADGGELEGMLDINIDLNMKRSDVILGSIGKTDKEAINVKDDFKDMIRIIEKEMIEVFDAEIISN